MAKKENKEGKKKRHRARNTVLGAAVLAVLAWLAAHFGGLGLGLGTGFGLQGTGDGEQVEATVGQTGEAVQTTEDTTQMSDTQEDTTQEPDTEESRISEINIRISEEEISVGEETYEDAKALKTYILSVYEEGLPISLQDDHAVKATYDEVKQMLEDLGYSYTEVQ